MKSRRQRRRWRKNMEMHNIMVRILPEFVSKMTNVEDVLRELLAKRVLIQCSYEDIDAQPTRSKKCGKLAEYMMRRPLRDGETLVDILDRTCNSHVADLIKPGRERPAAVVDGPAAVGAGLGMFEEVVRAVRAMAPIEMKTERSNMPVYKTAVDLYSGALPRSEIGLNDLPYVVALKIGHGRASVQAWRNCPTGSALTEAYAKYEREIESAKALIGALSGCTVLMTSMPSPAMTNAMKVLGIPSPYVSTSGTSGTADMYSPRDTDRLAAIIHLISYGSNPTYVFCRQSPPKPNCYLLLNAAGFVHTIPQRDRQVVASVLGCDESNHCAVEPQLVPCPF